MTTTDSTGPRIDHELRSDLRDAARAFLADAASPARVRELLADPSPRPALDAAIGELGWPGVEVPERHGGLGAGFGELCLIIAELGRTLAPTAFPTSAVLGVGALLHAPAPLQDAWLPRLATGAATVTAALTDARGCLEHLELDATPDGDGWRLTGSSGFVPDLAAADAIAVAATCAGEPLVLLVDAAGEGVERAGTPLYDHTRRLGSLRLEGARVGPDALIARGEQACAVLAQLARRGAIAIAADCVGGMERVLDLTVEHLQTRVQFDRPIGSFQAVAHRCADMLVAVEGARAAVLAAAWACDADPARAPRAAAVAKAAASDAAREVTASAIQVHGGVGFTWESPVHWLYKRAQLSAALWGGATAQRIRLVREHA